MSLWSRIVNAFRPERVDREIEEELQSHIDEAAAADRDPGEIRAVFGSALRHREASRDVRVVAWLDSLRADAVFGWRQLVKRRVTSAAAVLSLALAIGACTAAFRLIDALLLRPMPVKAPEELYFLSRQGIGPEGRPQTFDEWAYPAFQAMRAAVARDAELLAVGPAERSDITYSSDEEMEKAYVQHVSGRMCASFGLRPALGRLLTENDDLKPGAHPYAVISYDYWTRRFGRSAQAIGRTFRFWNQIFEIVGVVDGPFTGTETGTVTDVFLPAMMHPYVVRSDATWMRTVVRVKPGVAKEPIRQKLSATNRAFDGERAKAFTQTLPKAALERMLDQKLLMEPAAAGASGMQRNLRRPLETLAVLVALVLLIACANVANLMTAQAAARAREMALRVSIGAGRWRLAQLVLVESAMLALLSASAGGLFAWWAAPFVTGRINPPDNPARLSLPADWRVLGFGLALTLGVTLLFGLAPALHVSSVRPVSAIKGGEDPHARRRLMHGLIAVQAAFCFLALLGAGLFVATFERLANLPTGFATERILIVETVSTHKQPLAYWEQTTERLRSVPGVETAALADWTLLNGNSRNNFISVGGAMPGPILAYFRYASPGWIGSMKIPLLDGRDFRAGDTSPGSAIVTETFAKAYFPGENPVGKWFERVGPGPRLRYQIVGLARDIRYKNLREPILPVVFVPLSLMGEGAFVVRTAAANPLALASVLRHEVPRARPEFRVTNIRTQAEINQRQTLRERLLAMLAAFFAAVAVLLAGIGLYGVLDYSVLQRRREIGIRMAIGARAGHIARRVTAEAFAMVLGGAIVGCGLGMASVRYVQSLVYQVKATDLAMLALPSLTIFAATLAAALPAVIRAVRIDPAVTLRGE
jgi:predicted permease